MIVFWVVGHAVEVPNDHVGPHRLIFAVKGPILDHRAVDPTNRRGQSTDRKCSGCPIVTTPIFILLELYINLLPSLFCHPLTIVAGPEIKRK